ncbi:FecR family protein [Flectobacillus roseus]|uniref:FecR family protein n=1 Tax=Flectobacillus roseus TaxID=502259 RepID=UPI0024B68374|nr:FecR family protein [Flectobacillus roseus]MDI9871405.1 FecR domain-containing protein [Flectobacillus roseus]
MQDYRQYKPTDFISDESFRAWVLENSEEETAFWEQWMLLNPDKRADILESKGILLSIYKAFDHVSDAEVSLELEKLNAQLDESEAQYKVVRWPWNKIFYAAASVLLIVGVFWLNKGRESSLQIEKSIALAQGSSLKWITKENTTDHQMTVNLEDGSTIVLQKNSKILYPEKFEKEQRKVILIGEAFFEVAKNPSRPFFVFADKLVTKVLGTSFLIQANENDKTVKVVVKTGKVSVFENTESNLDEHTNHKKLEGLVLTPNQQVVFDETDKRMIRSLVDSPNLLKVPIQNQVFEFTNVPISEVFKVLEKAYGVNIVYDADVMKNCYLTASLDDEPLFEKLNLICKTLDAKYEQVDAQIVIYSNGCY